MKDLWFFWIVKDEGASMLTLDAILHVKFNGKKQTYEKTNDGPLKRL